MSVPVPAISVPASMLPEDDLVPLPRFAVVKEHSYWTQPVKNPDGTVTPPRYVQIDKKRLERIAERGNSRLYRTGDLAPIIPGHTDDISPEEKQPRIVGYAIDYSVAPLHNDGKYAVWVTPLAKRNEVETFRKLKRRSVEFWENRDEIDPIALLGATTPEQDLGLHKFALQERNGLVRFSRDEPSVTIHCDEDCPPATDDTTKQEPKMADPIKDEGKEKVSTSGVADAPHSGKDADPMIAAVWNSKEGKEVLSVISMLKGMLGGMGDGAGMGEGEDPLAGEGGMGGGPPGAMPNPPPALVGGEAPPSPLGEHPDRMNAGMGMGYPGEMNASMPHAPAKYSRSNPYDFIDPGFAAPVQNDEVLRLSRQLAQTEQRLKQAEQVATEAQVQMNEFAKKFHRDKRKESIATFLQPLAQQFEFDFPEMVERCTDLTDEAVVAEAEKVKKYNRPKTPGFGMAPVRPEQQMPQQFARGVGGVAPIQQIPASPVEQHPMMVDAARLFHAGKANSYEDAMQQAAAASLGGRVMPAVPGGVQVR